LEESVSLIIVGRTILITKSLG